METKRNKQGNIRLAKAVMDVLSKHHIPVGTSAEFATILAEKLDRLAAFEGISQILKQAGLKSLTVADANTFFQGLMGTKRALDSKEAETIELKKKLADALLMAQQYHQLATMFQRRVVGLRRRDQRAVKFIVELARQRKIFVNGGDVANNLRATLRSVTNTSLPKHFSQPTPRLRMDGFRLRSMTDRTRPLDEKSFKEMCGRAQEVMVDEDELRRGLPEMLAEFAAFARRHGLPDCAHCDEHDCPEHALRREKK